MENRWRRGLEIRIQRLGRAASFACGLALLAGDAGAQLLDQELHFLYEVNRARHDPPAWAAEYGLDSVNGGNGQPTDLLTVEPRPPLALNDTLVDSSGFKAQEMAASNYFSHQSQVGPTFHHPNELVRNVFGYPLPFLVPAPGGGNFLFSDDFNSLESIACGFGPGGQNLTLAINALILLIVDATVPSLGHRLHILAMTDNNEVFTEAGVGYGNNNSATCRNYWAFHTGVTDPAGQFLTGVAYDDDDGNDLYDPGEGLAGVTVSVNGSQTTTNAAGGWSLAVADGTHPVSCQGGGFVGTAGANVSVSGANRQVDCVSGFDGLLVDFVPAWEPPASLSATLGVLVVAALARRRRDA